MKTILYFSILLYFFSFNCFAQELKTVNDISRNQKLITEAYEVFETNKFLDFKDKNILLYKVDNEVIKEIALNNYSSYKRDWVKIEQEDAYHFQENKNAKYSYEGEKIIELSSENGSYNVRKEIKTIYNSKIFVLLSEKKYFVGDNYNRTESIINEYDNRNKVIKIIKRTEYPKKEDNKEFVTIIEYEKDTIIITNENGIIVCDLK